MLQRMDIILCNISVINHRTFVTLDFVSKDKKPPQTTGI
jgi:hypothetical protein